MDDREKKYTLKHLGTIMRMIVIKNLVKTFKNGIVVTHALRGVSLEIKQGEFVAIMGKSGAGKSTLLYNVSLLDEPTGGEVIIDGIKTHELADRDKTRFRLEKLGYIFQDYALVPELTAVENVMVPLLALGYDSDTARAKSIEALEKVGLAHRLGNIPSMLSGGEQQRVSIARAVAHNPQILFADEPTANLDSISSQAVLEIFNTLHSSGQTIVMVTHEAEYTKTCDRVIYIADGQVVDEK
jgi:putative ABC transport system ATP-binding protein